MICATIKKKGKKTEDFMELKEALLNRRSVRKFTEESVSDEMINELLHAAMSGPSACNRRPWAFYVAKSEEARERLRVTSPASRMNAPLAIVVCGDLEKALPDDMATFWIQDTSAAVENILLRVTDLGLGAVWCGVHPMERAIGKVREALELPEHISPLGLIWIGHPADTPEPRDQYDEECVHFV